MAKIQDPTATFMMLCIRDFTNKLWIPTKFVRKYSEISEKKSVMLKTDSDRFWDVKIKRINEDLYMEEGWSEFVKDNKLTAFDFLTFRLLRLHGSTDFKVSVYGADGCPKRPAAAASSSSISDDDDDDDDEDEDEDEDEEEEDDDDEDDDDDEHEIKARYDNVKKRRVLSRPRGRPPKIVLRRTNVSMKRGQSKAQHDVVCVGSSNNIGSSSNNNPLYMEITLKHIQRSRLSIPTAFANKYANFLRQASLELKTGSARSWEVKIKKIDNKWFIADGWSEFATDNQLQEMNLLTFRISGESALDVSIFRNDSCLEDQPSTSGTNVSMKRGGSKARNDVVSVGSTNSNPLYLEICLKNHQRSRISLPAKFWKAGGLKQQKHVNMEFVASGYCKPIALDHKPLYRIDLATGWSDFRKATGIVVGKTYSFKYNPKQNVIRVKNVKK